MEFKEFVVSFDKAYKGDFVSDIVQPKSSDFFFLKFR